MSKDNRSYHYEPGQPTTRAEYSLIVNLIDRDASVIDYGCGNGSLMRLLKDKRSCSVHGIDISSSGVQAARAQGLSVSHGRIDEPHPEIANRTYDYAICNVTLQMVNYPEIVLREMARVARQQIVSFPNFAHFSNRWELLTKGRMPRGMLFGYTWYNTGHLHQLSISDFQDLCLDCNLGLKTVGVVGESGTAWKRWLTKRYPNLFSRIVVCLLSPREG